jgi:hypothetical protein
MLLSTAFYRSLSHYDRTNTLDFEVAHLRGFFCMSKIHWRQIWFDPKWRHEVTNQVIGGTILAAILAIVGAVFLFMTKSNLTLFWYLIIGVLVGGLVGIGAWLVKTADQPSTAHAETTGAGPASSASKTSVATSVKTDPGAIPFIRASLKIEPIVDSGGSARLRLSLENGPVRAENVRVAVSTPEFSNDEAESGFPRTVVPGGRLQILVSPLPLTPKSAVVTVRISFEVSGREQDVQARRTFTNSYRFLLQAEDFRREQLLDPEGSVYEEGAPQPQEMLAQLVQQFGKPQGTAFLVLKQFTSLVVVAHPNGRRVVLDPVQNDATFYTPTQNGKQAVITGRIAQGPHIISLRWDGSGGDLSIDGVRSQSDGFPIDEKHSQPMLHPPTPTKEASPQSKDPEFVPSPKPANFKITLLGGNVFISDQDARLTGVALEVRIRNSGGESIATDWALTITPTGGQPVRAQLTKPPKSLTLKGVNTETTLKQDDFSLEERGVSSPLRPNDPPIQSQILFYAPLSKAEVMAPNTVLTLTVCDFAGHTFSASQRMGDWLQH